MCGIAGVYRLPGAGSIDPAIAERMCGSIVHRGPDDQGIHATEAAHIGMRRLAIIDLNSGHQPIHNEDKSIWIVFNGEIYNYRELRRELEAAGHRFYTNTDTECIVHAYEQFGTDCFAKLRGMFGIAIHDLRHQRLVLARDRLGKKPLYYSRTPSGLFGFGSELKCLLELPGFDTTVRPESIRDYFALGYVPQPHSIYAQAFKLPPAHYLVLEGGEVSMRSYWQPDFEPKWTMSDRELQERLEHELEDAVKARLVSDVPFGAFLSGGTDSSVVAALMARNLSSPLKTFTIGFEEAAFNEMPDARAVARHLGAEHHELVVRADAVGMVDRLAWHFDEPFGDSSAIPTFLVSQLAAQHVKMVLSGDGGDELFSGYTRYRKDESLRRISRATGGAGGALLRAAGAMAGRTRWQRIGDRLSAGFPDRYLAGVALATRPDLASVLGFPIDADPFASVRHHFLRPDIASEDERILAGDMATYLVDDVLVKVDRMTMACSLEARAPLLDHQLIDFVARMPFASKAADGIGKVALKRFARKLLPADVLDKPKQGFAIPLAEWFRKDLRPMMMDILSDRRFRERGFVKPDRVGVLMAEHVAGTHDHSETLWLVLNLEMWARCFQDADAAHPSPMSSRKA